MIFSTNFVWDISDSKNWMRYNQKKYIGFHAKYPLLFSDFNETWIFSTGFRKILEYQIPWKSVQWQSSCSMRTDGHEEASSRFSQFRERALQHMLKLCKTDLKSKVQIAGKYIIKFIIWRQKTIVESQLRFQGFVPAFCGCLCPYGWVSIVTGLGRCCYYVHGRHVFPNIVFWWPVRHVCFLMKMMWAFPNAELLLPLSCARFLMPPCYYLNDVRFLMSCYCLHSVLVT